MVFCPHYIYQHEGWDYVMDVGPERYRYLQYLNTLSKDTLLLAAKDPDTDTWTKWLSWWKMPARTIMDAYDIHRSILWNEVVVETDYHTYEENYEAIRILGAVLEDKGFIPHYYFSGNKSVHVHLFVDFRQFSTVSMRLQEQVIAKYTQNRFVKEFMNFLRLKIARFWDLGPVLGRQSDEGLVKSLSHLIRTELSMNRLGTKTFLGYSYKDLSFIPYICAPGNGFKPVAGEIKLSVLRDSEVLLEEFLRASEVKAGKKRVLHRSQTMLNAYNPPGDDADMLKPCVSFILGDAFKATTDGYRRAMFILANELSALEGKECALERILAWNSALGEPLREGEIRYACSRDKLYTLNCTYVHDFLDSLGFKSNDYHPN